MLRLNRNGMLVAMLSRSRDVRRAPGKARPVSPRLGECYQGIANLILRRRRICLNRLPDPLNSQESLDCWPIGDRSHAWFFDGLELYDTKAGFMNE